MQILTSRYNLEFRKLTFYGITRPQSIRKSKQISGQTTLNTLQDIEFNGNFARNRDTRMVKNSVTRAVEPVSTIDTLFKNNLLKSRLKANSKLNLSVNPFILVDCIFFMYNILRPRDSVTHFHVQFQTGDFPQKNGI